MKECQCYSCKEACRHKPGWFLPKEAELVAEYLEIELVDLFKTKLAVDYWTGDNPIFLLSPTTINNSPGIEFPYDPTGQCIFFKKGLCEIHPVKPCECRDGMCTNSSHESRSRHKKVAYAWEDHQDQIKKLLGRNPEIEEPGIFDILSLFGSL